MTPHRPIPAGHDSRETTSALRAELERLRHEHALAFAEERTARQLAQHAGPGT
ncbi:hypothetical protein AB0L67_40680 [Streptomyces flaveolus]|uniref:hypothetical protein n=1 Tax=Streptomyces flaveolus TaxID=67297 RepID=UPI0034309902